MWLPESCYPIDTTFYVSNYDKNRIRLRYLYFALSLLQLNTLQDGSAMPGVSRENIYNRNIPLPTLKQQDKYILEVNSEIEIIEKLKFLTKNTNEKAEQFIAKIFK